MARDKDRLGVHSGRSHALHERPQWVDTGPEAEQKIRLKSDHDQAAMERLGPAFRVWYQQYIKEVMYY